MKVDIEDRQQYSKELYELKNKLMKSIKEQQDTILLIDNTLQILEKLDSQENQNLIRGFMWKNDEVKIEI